MILKTPESSKTGKSRFSEHFGTLSAFDVPPPPGSKNPDFLETGCSDHLETLAIDSTHQYSMWMQYEHHLTTLSDASKPKTLKNQEFHVFPVNFWDLSPPKPNHVQECRSIDFREYCFFSNRSKIPERYASEVIVKIPKPPKTSL